jgi:16S rRNA (cytosine967-C5)-methyltransferase
VRRWITLQFLAELHIERAWDECPVGVRAGLLVGAAQIVGMDRVPVSAAVNESVGWVRAVAGIRASSVVNAVLRRIAELCVPGIGHEVRETWTDRRDELPRAEGGALALAAPVLPEDGNERLEIATSTPRELLRGWSKSMSTLEVRKLALHGLRTGPVILNGAHARAPLPESAAAHTAPGHFAWTGTHDELLDLLRSRNDVWVQDPASSLAVESAAHLTPALVIDACAGQGTKTRQLAATFPNAKIIATDIDLPRLATLRRTFQGQDRVEVIEFGRLIDHVEKAELLMLDVPCSNTGVLGRRVEAKYRFSEKGVESLVNAQRQIIADTIRLLKPRRGGGGSILYSTCSLDPRENEDQARWMVRWHDLDIVRESRRLPQGAPGEDATRYSDGSYAALLA